MTEFQKYSDGDSVILSLPKESTGVVEPPPYLSDPLAVEDFDPVLRRQERIFQVPETVVRNIPLWQGGGVEEPPSPRRKALEEAADLIDGERDAEYGRPEVNFQRIADVWQVLFPEREWTPEDVARAMIALKLARTPQGHKRDTFVDIAGYAAIAVELGERA